MCGGLHEAGVYMYVCVGGYAVENVNMKTLVIYIFSALDWLQTYRMRALHE